MRVLFVDRKSFVKEIGDRLVGEFGCSVDITDEHGQAFEILTTWRPSVVVVEPFNPPYADDCLLADGVVMDGYEPRVTLMRRAMGMHIPVIAASVRSQDTLDFRLQIKAGVDYTRYVDKVNGYDRIPTVVREVMGL